MGQWCSCQRPRILALRGGTRKYFAGPNAQNRSDQPGARDGSFSVTDPGKYGQSRRRTNSSMKSVNRVIIHALGLSLVSGSVALAEPDLSKLPAASTKTGITYAKDIRP